MEKNDDSLLLLSIVAVRLNVYIHTQKQTPVDLIIMYVYINNTIYLYMHVLKIVPQHEKNKSVRYCQFDSVFIRSTLSNGFSSMLNIHQTV